MGTSGRLYQQMRHRIEESKSSYVVMLMTIMLGTSWYVVRELNSLCSSIWLLLVGITNTRTRWNLPYFFWILSPRRQQWRSFMASVTSYARWAFPFPDPLICMRTICQLFKTYTDLNIFWRRNRILSVIMTCARTLLWAKCLQHMSGVKIIHRMFVQKWYPLVPSRIIVPRRCFTKLHEQSGFQVPKVSWSRFQISSHISIVIFIILLVESLI